VIKIFKYRILIIKYRIYKKKPVKKEKMATKVMLVNLDLKATLDRLELKAIKVFKDYKVLLDLKDCLELMG